MPEALPSLPAAAAQLAALLPRERLDPAVRAWVERTSPRRDWAIGFSGGADSLALLLLLWAHWPERRARLWALHFNHRLRGAASRADAVYCRKVCAALKIKFSRGSWRGASADASEAEARAARLAFFAKAARVVWLGHQQDDIAESMLMRLARGSGAGGLAAPRPVQRLRGGRVHLRPLLGVKKAELVAALRQAGISWCEDASNAGGAYFRNRIRRDVIPAWLQAAQRDGLAGAARSRALLEEDDAALEALAEGLNAIDRAGRLQLARLAGQPRAIWRRVLHRWLLRQPDAAELSRQAFDALLGAIERGRPARQSLGRHGFAVVSDGWLRYTKAGKPRRTFQGRAN